MPTTEQIQQIQTKIDKIRNTLHDNKAKLEQLRVQRGQLAIESSTKNSKTIARLDEQIESVRKDLENLPVQLKLLEELLTAEKKVAAQKERDALLEKQKEIARDVEALSEQFIELLKQANYANEQLRLALRAETGLKEKTGQQFLENYCHGSQQSLRMLLETMKAQMEGQHTIPAEQLGMVGNATPIRL